MTRPRPFARAGRGGPESLPVVVLDVFASGLAIARRMSGLGAQIVLISEWRRPEMRTRAAHHGHVLPFGEAWLEALEGIAATSPGAVVIPGTDRASELLGDAAGRLPAELHFFERVGTAHRALMAKDTAETIARAAGVPVPFTAQIARSTDLEQVADEAPWPCVLKPVSAHLHGARVGGRRTVLVRDVAEARRHLDVPLAAGVPMLLSQYIPGGDGDVEEAIVVRLADGSLPVQFGVHKLRQFPAGFGETALGESAHLPESSALAARVLAEAGFVGVAGVEVKRDCHTGERWFLEVNVRVPNQWGLGDACGADATRRLVAVLAGRADTLGPQPLLREGVGFVTPEKDLPLLLERLAAVPAHERPMLAAAHLRPWVRARERTVLSLRDPAPGVEWLRTAIGAIRREGLGAQF